MAGSRTALFLLVAALAVGVVPSIRQQPIQFGFVIASPKFAIMRHEVTTAQWRQCFEDKACEYMPERGRGATDDEYPVTDVNWFDVSEFIAWARQHSGQDVRLPTAEEWQSASHIKPLKPKLLFDDPRLDWAAEYGALPKMDPTLRRAGFFGATPEGATDFLGNVWEWTSSCASSGFKGADADFCPAFRVLGEHEAKLSVFTRDPATGGCAIGTPPSHVGFRLVVTHPVGKSVPSH
jgi:formylglycine-generating enzyme required for sulfatase activity